MVSPEILPSKVQNTLPQIRSRGQYPFFELVPVLDSYQAICRFIAVPGLNEKEGLNSGPFELTASFDPVFDKVANFEFVEDVELNFRSPRGQHRYTFGRHTGQDPEKPLRNGFPGGYEP